MANLPNQDRFAKIARALTPYRDDLVIAGAWCHRLLHFHPLALAPAFAPLMSEDTDVVTPEQLPTRSPNIGALLEAAGFTAALSGSELTPVSKYVPEDDGGLYVEFIAPLRGDGFTRAGVADETLSIAGITASKLRHVELLLLDPWTYVLRKDDGFAVEDDEAVAVRVSNPATYLAQKVLTLNRRQQRDKKPKDALYIHDTLMMFGASFPRLREPGAAVLAQLPPKTAAEFHRLRKDLFQRDALVIEAAAVAAATGRPNPPSAGTISAVCTVGLEAIFASE